MSLCVLSLVGCDLDYGAPLGTLHGLVLDAPVGGAPPRIAIVWNNWSQGEGAQYATIQEGVMRGARFGLDLQAPPPPSALSRAVNFDGEETYSALGVIVAYQDTNENGQLDVIPQGAAPVDRIVGVSASWSPLSESEAWYMVRFLDGAIPEHPAGLQPGYNLLLRNEEVVPLNTSIPVAATFQAADNLYVCEGMGNSTGGMPDWNSCLGPGALRMFATLEHSAGTDFVYLQVCSGAGEHRDAQVTVNEVSIPYDEAQGAYALDGPQGALLRYRAANEIRVRMPDGETLSRTIWVDAPLSFHSPPSGAALPWDEPLRAGWSSEAGVAYHLRQTVEFPEGTRGRSQKVVGAERIPFPALGTRPDRELKARLSGYSFRYQGDGSGTEVQSLQYAVVNFRIAP